MLHRALKRLFHEKLSCRPIRGSFLAVVKSYQFQDFGFEISKAGTLASVEDCHQSQGVGTHILFLAHLQQNFHQFVTDLRFQLKI